MSLLIIALLPPVFLMYVVYKQDKIESEPLGLVFKVLLLGALSCIPVIVLELLADVILETFLEADSFPTLYILLDNFLCVALIEELGKYLAAKSVWKKADFNYRFDGIVYAAAAAIGFAALENVMYVFENGFGVGIMRAVLSVPGHCIDGIFMGAYIGEAKFCFLHDDRKGMKTNLRKAILIPTILHGIYDSLLSFENDIFFYLFLLFVIVLDVIAIRRVKKHSKNDTLLL